MSKLAAPSIVLAFGSIVLGCIAGVITVGQEQRTFVLRLDAELETICAGTLANTDVGLAWPPELRGLAVGDDVVLYTGSYVVTSRRSVYARWD